MKTRFILLLTILYSTHSIANQNWADDKDYYSQDPEFNSSKAICNIHRHMSPPVSDFPTKKEINSLKNCDAAAIYYGIGQPVNVVLARKCALIPGADEYNILMDIYANGKGVKRNIDLAIYYACHDDDSAPAEYQERVEHLENIKEKKSKNQKFDYCDDTTSGEMTGYCEGLRVSVIDYNRSLKIEQLQKKYTSQEKQLYTKLIRARNAYIDASSSKEVDQSGTLRSFFGEEQQEDLTNQFDNLITQLETKKEISSGMHCYKWERNRLNTIYNRLMNTNDSIGGTVTKDDVRFTQKKWLKYRDAWIRFAHIRYPTINLISLKAYLIHQRLHAMGELM